LRRFDNRTYTDVTATENGVQGKYNFCGLIPGNYRMVVPPFGYVPTLIIDAAGNTQDVIDSDNPAGVNFTVPELRRRLCQPTKMVLATTHW
jgi:hypothetical protein